MLERLQTHLVRIAGAALAEFAAERSTPGVALAQVKAVAVQLMEVVYRVQDNSWLVKLLRGMIFGPDSGDKQKKVPSKARKGGGGGGKVTEEVRAHPWAQSRCPKRVVSREW